MKIIPYVEINGQRTIPDHVMIEIYNRMDELGLVDKVFYAETIDTEQKFLMAMKRPTNVVNVVVEDEKVVGLFWLNNVYHNSAFGHFCMFPEIWGRKTIECTRKNIDYWFDFKQNGEPVLDVIIGKIPAVNKKAIKFIERCGFTILGTIPLVAHGEDKNKRVGDTIMYLTREERSWVAQEIC